MQITDLTEAFLGATQQTFQHTSAYRYGLRLFARSTPTSSPSTRITSSSMFERWLRANRHR